MVARSFLPETAPCRARPPRAGKSATRARQSKKAVAKRNPPPALPTRAFSRRPGVTRGLGSVSSSSRGTLHTGATRAGAPTASRAQHPPSFATRRQGCTPRCTSSDPTFVHSACHPPEWWLPPRPARPAAPRRAPRAAARARTARRAGHAARAPARPRGTHPLAAAARAPRRQRVQARRRVPRTRRARALGRAGERSG